MAAPIICSVEASGHGPVQQLYVPVPPYGYLDPASQIAFAGAPECCEAAWFHACGGYGVAMWPCSPHSPTPWQTQRPWLQAIPRPQPQPQAAEPRRPVRVRLSNLPRLLCTRGCLDAALEQARLDHDVSDVEIVAAKADEAVVILTSEAAGQRCIKHFHGLRWAKNDKPISARYTSSAKKEQAAEEPARRQQEQPPSGGAREAGLEALTQKDSTARVGNSTAPSWAGYTEEEQLHVRGLVMTPLPGKQRWSDFDSDDEFDDDGRSTFAGTCDGASSIGETVTDFS